jgi:methylenetetrahydrofolate--tRNA-(uracil-5-)-methyltransferase
MSDLIVIGGGLAGSEAAWQAAQRGLSVTLYEMRPEMNTPAHNTSYLGELVCSNSLGSTQIDRASGLLNHELKKLGSHLLQCAEETSLPAGGSLAVDRTAFAARVTELITSHPSIDVVHKEIQEIPASPTIIASGPLTSPALALSIQSLTGAEYLFFYDAIAPVVDFDSIDMEIAFRGSRFNHGTQIQGDYINCPLTQPEYEMIVNELINAPRIQLKEFEVSLRKGVRAGSKHFFEGCLPIEELALRGKDTLAYGPMRPVGLVNPHTGTQPYAVVQLRQDNLAGTMYNLVGLQTNLKFGEQERIFRLIPGLENAEFIRFGQMHRNTFIASPILLNNKLQFSKREDLFFAGQITGIEGYLGNIASGLVAGINVSNLLLGYPLITLPITTMIGGLINYITNADMKDFQPMKANFGILPTINAKVRGKPQRAALHVNRALTDMDNFLRSQPDSFRLV